MSLPRPSLTSLFEICTLQECCHHGSFAESYDAVSTACDSLPAKTYNAMDVEAFDTRRDSYNHHHSLTQKTPSFQSLDTKTLEQREADSFDHNACISPTDFQMSIENMRPRELFPIFCLDGSTADHSICLEPSTSPADNQDAQSGTVGDAEEHQKLPDDAYCKKLSSDESRQERMELDALLLKVEKLIHDEYILASHKLYLEILHRIDCLLKKYKLRVVGLIRPAGYLSSVDERDLTTSFVKLNSGETHLPSQICNSKCIQYAKVFGRSASMFSCRSSSFIAKAVDPSWYRSLHSAKKFPEKPHSATSIDTVSGWGLQSISDCHFAPLGVGTLAEPVVVCPLTSQTFLQPNTPNEMTAEGTTESLLLANSIMTTGIADSENGKQDSLLGRVPLQCRVWLLGDLPAVVFAVKDVCAEHGASVNIVRQQQLDPPSTPEAEGQDNPGIFSYSYKKRTVGGLSLPVDIQVVLIMGISNEKGELFESVYPAFANLPHDKTKVSVPGATVVSFFEERDHHAAPMRRGSKPQTVEARSMSSEISSVDGFCSSDFISWIHAFLERLVNNPQIHRLRMQYYQTKKALAVLASSSSSTDKSWSSFTTKDYHAIWKTQQDGNAICVIEGEMKAPLFQCLSLINESDLHKNWLPFLSESQKIHQMSQFAQVVCQRANFPWPLHDVRYLYTIECLSVARQFLFRSCCRCFTRETLMVGYAIDGLELPTPSVIMNGESVPDDAISVFGLPLRPPRPGLTRMRVKFFTFVLRPNAKDLNTTLAKLIVFLDPQITFIPRLVQNFIARQTATRLFTNMQQLCAKFDDSVYAQRVEENRETYENVKQRLQNFYAGYSAPQTADVNALG